MIGKEEQLKKEQANLYAISRFMKDDASNIHEDSTTEDKSYSLDELHILDMIEQGSTNKVTAEHGGTEEELARRRRLCELHCQCEVYFLQCRRDFGLLHLEQTEKECLGQLARATHMAASNLKSLQLKAAVDSWNAIVTDVRNKIAFLRMTRIAWTLPAPVGEAVPPSASLGRDPLVMDWEKVLERLKTAFPQQTRKELTDFVRKLKDTHGKSLSGLTFDEIVHKISQFIDPKRSQDDEEEEPCVICHENLSPDNLSVLPCAHKFHAQEKGTVMKFNGQSGISFDEQNWKQC
ncbi:DZIP3 [Cervus elaphus hippelaphus]|uniref:DZIP3 n=1 Tax=Cervus elaphus hippelaphus TaxID=46360 RepID=A0A212C3K8_CEREH|nr:DZIP3 [Cervus elaphus hippelaphus]